MKLKKLAYLALIPSLFAFSATACSGGDDKSSESLPPNVVVTFYIDFNQPNSDEYYDQVTIEQGGKVTAPADPTEAPFPEFPVFMGWSAKEIIKSKADLWDFSNNTITSKSGTFEIYGIWVAEGENK